MNQEVDRFLEHENWHTTHPNDTARFMKMLHIFIRDPKFNPDVMGAYMKDKLGVSPDDEDPYFNNAVDRYVTAAWAIKEYLEINRL